MRRAARIVVAVASCVRGVVVAPVAVGALVTPAVATAQEEEPDRVLFVLHDQSPAAGVLQTFDSMQGQLGELELDISAVHLTRAESLSEEARQAARIAEQERAKAVFWFADRAGESVRVYALHVPSGRVFGRDVNLDDDATVQREQLAIVLRAAIPAVLDGGLDLGEPLLVVPPEPAGPPDDRAAAPTPRESSPATRPVRVRRRPAPPRLRAAAGYSGSTIARDANWQSGVSGEVVLDTAGWLRASLGAGYAAPTTVEGDGADATVTRVPVVARVGVGRPVGRATAGLEAGVLADGWHRRTIVRTDALEPTEPSTRWRLGGSLAARFEILVGAGMGLYFLGEAQWLPAPHELTVRSAETEQQLTTNAIRPHVGLGVTFDLLWHTSNGVEVE